MRVPKRSVRQEYRLKQREQIQASPLMAEKFPGLTGLKVTLLYLDSAGTIKSGEMKCTMNVDRAKSALWFACPRGECTGGDFDLTKTLAEAVAGRRRVVMSQLQCRGTRTRGDHEQVPCQMLLRYKLTLNYG